MILLSYPASFGGFDLTSFSCTTYFVGAESPGKVVLAETGELQVHRYCILSSSDKTFSQSDLFYTIKSDQE